MRLHCRATDSQSVAISRIARRAVANRTLVPSCSCWSRCCPESNAEPDSYQENGSQFPKCSGKMSGICNNKHFFHKPLFSVRPKYSTSARLRSIEISRDCGGAPPTYWKRAGNGNRTRMASLEGWNFTIKLCPRRNKLSRHSSAAKSFFEATRQEPNGGRLLFGSSRSS